MTAGKNDTFRRTRTSAEEKAAQTDAAAKDIIAAEAIQRARKTERLRKLREAQGKDLAIAAPARRRTSAAASKKPAPSRALE